MIIDEANDIAHFGVRGMRWGVRKPRDEAARAKKFGGKKTSRKERKAKAAADHERAVKGVLEEVGRLGASDMYAIRGSQGNLIMTGEEFLRRMDRGMRVTDVVRTGQRINDGRTETAAEALRRPQDPLVIGYVNR
jgi:hypothetical protein